jgi:hypothetical protein
VNDNHAKSASTKAGNRPRGLAFSALGACLLAAAFAQPANANVVTEWNQLALGCINRAGPGSVLDYAVVQIAVHNAIQAIENRYQQYGAPVTASGSSSAVAAAAAAYYALTSDIPNPNAPDFLCPSATHAALLAAYKPYQDSGDMASIAVGQQAAQNALNEYRDSTIPPTYPFQDPYTGGTGIGQWRPTPSAPMAFLYLATKKPFAMSSPSQFRPGPPPAISSPQYVKDYNEVKEKGSVSAHPPVGACPAPANTDKARFWAGNFGVQWNQVVRDVAVDRQLGIGDTARLLALANMAGADAAIGIWDSKIFYSFWRPGTAINNDDGNPNTAQDATWAPFITAATHVGAGTPPYPDYLSGANGLTGAFAATLQLFFKTDNLPLAIYKAPPPNTAVPICTNPRLFRKVSDAAQEVVDARVLLGIHFRFADTGARILGSRVALNVYSTTLKPKHK